MIYQHHHHQHSVSLHLSIRFLRDMAGTRLTRALYNDASQVMEIDHATNVVVSPWNELICNVINNIIVHACS
jgi:hypothetical protein